MVSCKKFPFDEALQGADGRRVRAAQGAAGEASKSTSSGKAQGLGGLAITCQQVAVRPQAPEHWQAHSLASTVRRASLPSCSRTHSLASPPPCLGASSSLQIRAHPDAYSRSWLVEGDVWPQLSAHARVLHDPPRLHSQLKRQAWPSVKEMRRVHEQALRLACASAASLASGTSGRALECERSAGTPQPMASLEN